MKVLFKVVSALVLLTSCLIPTTESACGVCGSISFVACVSNTQYYYCPGGTIDTTSLSTCPAGTFCSNTNTVCEATPATTECPCNVCSTTMKFACVNSTSYALCLGTTTPSTTLFGNCASGTYCDITSGSYCSSTSTCYIWPSSTTTTTTAAPLPTTPDGWCAYYGAVGNYGITTDTTCKNYVKCTIRGSVLSGGTYTCVGSTVFNQKTRVCVAASGYTCPN